MKRKSLLTTLGVAVLFAAGGYAMYLFGMQRGMGMSAGASAAGGATPRRPVRAAQRRKASPKVKRQHAATSAPV